MGQEKSYVMPGQIPDCIEYRNYKNQVGKSGSKKPHFPRSIAYHL